MLESFCNILARVVVFHVTTLLYDTTKCMGPYWMLGGNGSKIPNSAADRYSKVN